MFTHIHKSAGTTMCEAARSSGKERVVKPMQNCNWKGEDIKDDFYSSAMDREWTDCKTRYEYFSKNGYTWGAIERELQDGDICPQFLNAISLRDPVDRIISLFDQISENQSPHVTTCDEKERKQMIQAFRETGGEECKCTISEHKEYAIEGSQLDNYITRIFNGQKGLLIPFGQLNQTHLEVAKTKLKSYDLILFTEELNSPNTARAMDAVLGWHVDLGERANPSHSEHAFTQKARENIRKMNRFDYELYDFAKMLKAWRAL